MTSVPAAHAVATGAQPEACPPTKRIGRRVDRARASTSSSKPRATRVNIAPDATGADDHVGRPPAERLGDLVGERLGALGVERAEVDVDEAPAGLVGDLEAQPVDVVVGAVDRHDRRAVGEGVVDLGRLEVGRDEDVGRQPDGGRGRRGRAGEVAGRRAGERLDAEFDGPGGGDRDRPVLERQRRVAGVVLDQQAIQPERRRQPVGRQQRRGADRQAARRRRVDGQQLEVAPDPGRASRDRLRGSRVGPGDRVVVLRPRAARNRPDRRSRGRSAARRRSCDSACRGCAGRSACVGADGVSIAMVVLREAGERSGPGYGTTVLDG